MQSSLYRDRLSSDQNNERAQVFPGDGACVSRCRGLVFIGQKRELWEVKFISGCVLCSFMNEARGSSLYCFGFPVRQVCCYAEPAVSQFV